MSKKHLIQAPPAFQSTLSETPEPSQDALDHRRARNEAAIRLLRKWMDDKSGYDEKTWPVVKKSIEDNRISHRRRFDE